MLDLPKGNIYLIDKNNVEENVSNTDCINKDEFIEEVNYLFDKCNYDKTKYIRAIYKEDNLIIYSYSLESW